MTYIGFLKTGLGFIEIQSEEEAITAVFFTENAGKELENEVIVLAKKEISEYLSGERENFDLPLQMKGTLFQRKVWCALSRIPYGETVTYSEIAEMAGNAKAIRAAASAIAANSILILIPCHRVIRKSKEIGKYSGGRERKRKLLELEKKKKAG